MPAPYTALARPFEEILLVCGSEPDGLAQFLGAAPFQLTRRDLPPPHATHVALYTRDTAPLAGPDEACALVSGFGNLGAVFLPHGPAIARHLVKRGPGIVADEALRGHFVALHGDGDGLRLFTDWMGVASFYEARLDGVTYLSNRVELLARIAARFHRSSYRLDRGTWAQGLVSDGRFGRSATGRRMHLDGFTWYAPDEFALIRDGQVECRQRYDLHALKPDPEAYRHYLDAAVREILENVEAALTAPQFSHRVLMLSGGYDSRIILAAIAALGRLDEVEATSWITGDGMDARIASGLVRLTGIRPVRVDAGNPMPHEDGLDRWTSLMMGMANQFNPQHDTVADLQSTQMIRLVGGGGETLRGHIARVALPAFGGGSPGDSVEHLFKQVFEGVKDESIASPECSQMAFDRHLEVTRDLPGHDAFSRLDMTQFYFKARVFFGDLALAAFVHHPYLTMPLFSPAAVKASLSTTPEHRFCAGVIFDLMMRLFPPLAYFPYDRGGWPDGAVGKTPGASLLKTSGLELDCDVELMAKAPWVAPVARPGPRTQIVRGDVVPWMAARAPELLEEALSCREWASLVDVDRARGRLDWVARHRPLYLAVWTSRLAALKHYRSLVDERVPA